ncbi:glycosyltransferase [Natronococcus sp. JC468]|uniref:glycosyltransferase n=1 Tax=Natronococcus sp. JC468 TaxID=1961921 RepID=UPI00143AB020|nr:glycosyltransferase [Natronococcus sp. JC468]NKE36522.1 glycosyltransferase [Natronococcus sp. JC468]
MDLPGENRPDISMYVPSLRGGGAERVIVRLANQFAEQGYSVELVLGREEGAYLDHVSEAVTVVDLDTRRYLAAVPKLVDYLRTRRPTVLLSTIDTANVAAIVATKLSRVETRVVIRISNMMSVKEEMLDQPKHRLVHLTAKRTYKHADHVIGVSAEVTDDVVTNFGVPQRRASTVYNPVVNEDLRSQSSERVDHPWFHSDRERPIVLGVGELADQKDFATLIEALAATDYDPEPRLVILGEGQNREPLERLAREHDIAHRVDLPGFVDNPYSYMADSDVFALSSKWEGCPNVLIEAMACGTPLVATDCRSGPREILAAGEYGELVPVGDVEKLSQAISSTLAADHDTDTLAQRAERFSVSAIADEYLHVLEHGVVHESHARHSETTSTTDTHS